MLPSSMPRQALQAALALVLGLAFLVHGYTRPGLRVIEKKEVEVKLPPEAGLPPGPVPSWFEKPPTTQKVIQNVSSIIREQGAMVRVTAGAIARTAAGELVISETKPGNARCPT